MQRAISGWKRCYPMAAELRRRRSFGASPAPWRGILDGFPSPPARRSPFTLLETPVFMGFRMLFGGAETLSGEAPTPSTSTNSSLPMSSVAVVPGDKIRVFVEVHTYVSYSFSLFVDPKATVNTMKTMAQNKACIYFPDMFVYLKCNIRHDDCTLEAPRKRPYYYCNKLLEDDASITVEECGIKDKDRILVLQRQSIILGLDIQKHGSKGEAPCAHTMARSFDTVGTLKKKINKELGIPVEKQSLQLKGRSRKNGSLDDDESLLLSYGITVPHETPSYTSLNLFC